MVIFLFGEANAVSCHVFRTVGIPAFVAYTRTPSANLHTSPIPIIHYLSGRTGFRSNARTEVLVLNLTVDELKIAAEAANAKRTPRTMGVSSY